MSLSRRAALRGTVSALAVGALAACQSGAGAFTPAQIVADAQGLIAALRTAEPLIVAADPNLLSAADRTTLETDLGLAATLAAGLSAKMAASDSASTLAKIETYVNGGLDLLSSVATAGAGTPLAPYAGAIRSAIVLARVLEDFVNATAPASGGKTAALRARAVTPAMTPDQARRALNIRIVA